MRCLAKDPADRPQSATEIVHTLDAVASSGGLPSLGLARRRVTLVRALAVYAATLVGVAILARAAVIAAGLPDWAFTGALIVMGLGLPVVLVAGLSQHMASRAAGTASGATPRELTPGSSTGADAPTVPAGTLQRLAIRTAPVVTWERVVKLGAGALGTFALAVGVIMVLRVFGMGPAASLVGEGKLASNDRVIVTDFHAAGADSSLGRIAAEALRTELGQSRTIGVVPASAVAAALERMQRSTDTTVDLPLARDIAVREGIKAVVDGEVRPLGSGYLVVVRLVAAQSGNELANFRETADAPSDLIHTLDKISRAVRERVGESLRSVRATPALADVTTGSLEALRRYASASRAIDMDGDYDKAIPLLQQAIERDSTFAMAYRKLGVAYQNGGYPPAKADSALTRAFRYRDRLPQRERLATEGTYYGTGPGRDRQNGAAAYEALLEIDPDNIIALNNLGLIYLSRRNLEGAERVYRRAASLPEGASVAFSNLERVLVSEGKLGAADSVHDAMARRFPNQGMNALDGVPVLYARGERDSIRALLERSRSSDTMIIRLRAINLLSDLDAIEGRLKESIRRFDDAQAANATRGGQDLPWLHAYLMATDDIVLRGEPARGVQRLDSLRASATFASIPHGDRPYAALAEFYALARRADKASEMMSRYEAEVAQLDSAGRANSQSTLHSVRGFVRLAEGAPQEALREFRLSDTAPDGPTTACGICVDAAVGLAFDHAQAPDSAIAYYESFVNTPFYARSTRSVDGLWLAYISRRLGELYEQKGNRERAAAYYQKFVDLWKDADPDLQPQVADVKRRLAHLTDLERS